MKRRLAAIIMIVMVISAFSGCARQSVPDGRISVVCTFFPQYDWVRAILGDRAGEAELTLLSQGGVDLHSFQPSAQDIVRISTCDLFIYVGGESDAWVKDVLAEAVNPDMIVLSLIEILGAEAKTEEIIEGMEDPEAREEAELDEHVWLSLRNAGVFCAAVADALCAINPDHAAEYQTNAGSYQENLAAVDSLYKEVVDAAPVKTLLFGDRFPFRYLVDDYGLSYYAAFPGCSAETEASFETIVFLTEKLGELNLRTVMVTESADQSIAKTIIDSAGEEGGRILVLNAIQSVTSEDAANGVTYLSLMEENLRVLQDALSDY